METIAFLSSLMFLGIFATLFWFDRTRRQETTAARDEKGSTPNAAD